MENLGKLASQVPRPLKFGNLRSLTEWGDYVPLSVICRIFRQTSSATIFHWNLKEHFENVQFSK